MKWLAALWGVAGGLGALYFQPRTDAVHLIILGNHLGYLSPCGCTEPMLGGILRQASAVRAIQSEGPSVLIDSGNISATDSEQELLKADTLVETLHSLGAVAINLTYLDSKFGQGVLDNLQSLSGNTFVSSSLVSSPGLSFDKEKESHGFLITGISSKASVMADRLSLPAEESALSVRSLVDDAKAKGIRSVLMVDGSREEAVGFAHSFPDLDVVICHSTAKPSLEPHKIGKTLIISTGERGEFLVDLTFSGNAEPDYKPVTLGPSFPDDRLATKLYETYLKRVGQDHLWEKQIRMKGQPFAGSASCAKCHEEDYRIWKSSSHAAAYQTLSTRGHDSDPECIRCHVTGADVKTGFKTLTSTPQFAAVGCESCHGAAAAHVANPHQFRLPKIGQKACLSCHELLNSPNFDYFTYWPKIRHGAVEKGWKP